MTAKRVMLCLALAASGAALQSCVGQGGRPPDTGHVPPGDYIEFVSPGSCRYLISKGVAKITLSEPSENTETSGKEVTVVLPCSSAEVARLIAVLEAAYGYGPGRASVPRMQVILRPPGPRKPDSIRWQVDGNLRDIPPGYMDFSEHWLHLWQWIHEELDQVSQVDLARAIVWREKAEALAQTGNQKAACESYRTSCTHLAEWVNTRAMRLAPNPTGHYEAEIGMAEPIFAYQSGDYSGSLEGFRHMWEQLGLKKVHWSNKDGAIVVESGPGERAGQDSPGGP